MAILSDNFLAILKPLVALQSTMMSDTTTSVVIPPPVIVSNSQDQVSDLFPFPLSTTTPTTGVTDSLVDSVLYHSAIQEGVESLIDLSVSQQPETPTSAITQFIPTSPNLPTPTSPNLLTPPKSTVTPPARIWTKSPVNTYVYPWAEGCINYWANRIVNLVSRTADPVTWVKTLLPEEMFEMVEDQLHDSPSKAAEILEQLVRTELCQAAMKRPLVEEGEAITPWDIVHFPESLAKLFSSPAETVPVEILAYGVCYERFMTEELFYGITLMLGEHPDFQFSIYGKRVQPKELTLKRYLALPRKVHLYQYQVTVNLHGGSFTYLFNTTDFIRGLITACDWAQLDTKQIISNVVMTHDKTGNALSALLPVSFSVGKTN